MTKYNETEVLNRVDSLRREGRYRTALDTLFPLLNSDPDDQWVLELAAAVLLVAFGPGHNLNPIEPLTEDYFSDTRLDPLFCECTKCRGAWVHNPFLSKAVGVIMFNPAGGICPKCDKVFCRECSENRKDNSYDCPDCGTRLVAISKPNGRTPQQTRRRKERLKLVLMLHEGPVPPDDEYLTKRFRRVSPDILNDKPEIKVLPVFPWPDSRGELWIKAKTLLPSQDNASDSVIIDDYFFSDDEGNHFYLIKVYELMQNTSTVKKAKLWITTLDFLRNLFGKNESASTGEITEAQKAAIEKLLEDLRDEYNIEARIKASEELGKLKSFGEKDVVSALVSAAINAAMQWEVKRMTIAAMHGVSPEQIEVQPVADDSRVTIAAIKVLRKLANRKDDIGKKSKAVLEDIRKSIKNAELVRKIGF